MNAGFGDAVFEPLADVVAISKSTIAMNICAPGFFEVGKYPIMAFKAHRSKKRARAHKLTGNLTIHGIAKPITLDFGIAEQ